MRFPGRQRPQLFGVLHIVQKGKHLAELVYSIGRNAFYDVVRIEASSNP
jgi:hypothetical protein